MFVPPTETVPNRLVIWTLEMADPEPEMSMPNEPVSFVETAGQVIAFEDGLEAGEGELAVAGEGEEATGGAGAPHAVSASKMAAAHASQGARRRGVGMAGINPPSLRLASRLGGGVPLLFGWFGRHIRNRC